MTWRTSTKSSWWSKPRCLAPSCRQPCSGSPKCYGPGENADLGTVYGFRNHPQWRWTHGYVENVAHAIVLATTSPGAVGRTYNVGEASTPTIAERLAKLPPSAVPGNTNPKFNFAQDIAYDTARIRAELGYRELTPEDEAMLATAMTNG